MKYKPPKNIREKKAKREFQKQFWSIFLIEGSLFLITSILAVVGAFKLNKLVKAKEIYLPTLSLQDFLFSFLIVTFFVLLFVSVKKAGKFKEIIYKGFFIITCLWGGMTILDLWLPVFGSILTMGVLIALWLKLPSVWAHDALIVLGLSGAASFFGLGFSPAVVVALLVIFSFYDFIAVYKTKHMIAMAKDMIEKKVILGFIIPKEIKYFKDKLDKVKPNGNFMILGGGDVVFPNLLAVSVIPAGFLKALIVVFFSLIGSLFSYYLFINQKEKEPIPALPPVALFAIIGYFITLLF
jgi:presenilin-like A22 family membrane protease